MRIPVAPSSLLATVVLVIATALAFAAEPASKPAAEAGKVETKEGGLKVTHVAAGSGEGAREGDTVWVLYTGKLLDGTEFDSSAKHGNDPIEFIIGKQMVIRGWEIGITGMLVGEKRTLVIPAPLAYGAEGRPPVIPANATLTFDVQLVGIKRDVSALAAGK